MSTKDKHISVAIILFIGFRTDYIDDKSLLDLEYKINPHKKNNHGFFEIGYFN